MERTEDWVRGLTGWKAFREGKAIAGRARVAGFKQRGDLLTGTFKEGRRTLRTVVRGGEAVSVECACEENRRSGAICCHGVALLLQAIADAKVDEVSQIADSDPVQGELVACRVVLPEGFEVMLGKGRLAVRLEKLDQATDQIDAGLSLWLGRHAPGAKFPKLLSLGEDQLEEFLEVIAGHSRLEVEPGGRSLRVEDDRLAPLPLSASSLRAGRLRLELDDSSLASCHPVKWGRQLGLAVEGEEGWILGRLPANAPSLRWRDEAVDLIESGCLELSEGEFIEGADAWLDLFELPAPGWLGELRFEASELEVGLELEGSLNAIDAKAWFCYPGGKRHLLGPDQAAIDGFPRLEDTSVLRTRNRRAESLALGRIGALGFEAGGKPGDYRLRDSGEILSLLADHLPEIRRDWTVRIGDRLSHVLKSVHVVRPTLEAGGGGSLEWNLGFQTDAGKAVPRDKVRQILASGRRAVKTSNGAHVVVASEVSELVEPLLLDLGVVSPGEKIQLEKSKALCLQELRKKLVSAQKDNTPERSEMLKCPEGIEADLRVYQAEGFSWLVDRLNSLSGALLADEMGLGKTIQTIAAIEYFKQHESRGAALVVVPTSLIGNWREELRRFAPGLSLVVLHGVGRDELRSEVDSADVVLTSYGTLVRDLAFHLRQSYGLLVGDEASLLRNPDSEISRTVAKLKAAKRLLLTGTPVENRLRDLWSLFRVVAPGYLGAKDDFLERYEMGEGAAERLRIRVSPYVLRRTKREVAKDLPEKVLVDEWLDLSAEARALYGALSREGLAKIEELESKGGAGRMHLLTLLLRLRQVCLDPALVGEDESESIKTKRLIELLEERHEQGRKTLVFSQFRTYLRRIYEGGDLPAGRVFLLDGSTRDRAGLVRQFQEAEGSAVFLISLKAGGYGLNLTAADTVIHMDPWWNPAVEAQASDRAHRIGQVQPVTIYRLLARDTVEERVRRMQSEKQSVIDAVSGGSDSVPQNWNESDLRSLVG